MNPPTSITVLDTNGGFTAVTTLAHGQTKRFPALVGKDQRHGGTLWRQGRVLKKKGIWHIVGYLVEKNEKTFYQMNDDVTLAIYRIASYPYPIAVFFDNKTGKRIA